MQKTAQFTDFSIHPLILKAIEHLGYETPTPVQEKTIPSVMEGKDVISLAETGSGKTAAYLIPTLTAVFNEKEQTQKITKKVLILAPTRELAAQIGQVITELTRFSPYITSAILIGGADMFKQIKNLKRGPTFIVATPGRLMDHVRRQTCSLKDVSTLILDEADRMFDMGFAPQVKEIVNLLPKERQSLLFSATFPNEIRTLAKSVLRNPVEIELRTKGERAPVVIEQKTVEVNGGLKNEKTLDLINAAKGSVIIFTRTKSRTDRLARFLSEYGLNVARIHGDRSQGQRNKSIRDFKSGEVRILVATDLAARGLDVSSITDVINYDIPMNSEDYLHRIGRTGRAGQAGQALTLLTPEDKTNWYHIARRVGIPVEEPKKKSAPSHGGGGGGPKRHHHGRPQKKHHGRNSHQSRR